MPKLLNRILSWYPGRRCWRKKYKGQTHYLGTGGKCNGPDDRHGYEQALGEWFAIKQRIDAGLPAALAKPPVLAKLVNDPMQSYGEPIVLPVKTLQTAARFAHNYALDPDLSQAVLTSPTDATIAEAVKAFTGTIRQKAELGERSIRTYHEAVHALGDFKAFCERHGAKLGIETLDNVNAPVLNLYRQKQLDLLRDRKHSAFTAKRRLQFLKRLLEWAYENELLERLPRNLSKNYARVDLPDPTPRPLTLDEVKALWAAATTKGKFSRKSQRAALYTLLGINCGYRSGDIATLKHTHIKKQKDGWYLVRTREKTGSPQCHKLWEQTRKLLEAEMTDPELHELVLLDERNQPLVTESFDAKTGCSDCIGRMFQRLREKLEWTGKGRGHSSLRDTGAQFLKDRHHQQSLIKEYLGHKNRDVVRHYVTDSFESYKPLFEALDAMGKHFDLTM